MWQLKHNSSETSLQPEDRLIVWKDGAIQLMRGNSSIYVASNRSSPGAEKLYLSYPPQQQTVTLDGFNTLCKLLCACNRFGYISLEMDNKDVLYAAKFVFMKE
jgi:hypothetical protein